MRFPSLIDRTAFGQARARSCQMVPNGPCWTITPLSATRGALQTDHGNTILSPLSRFRPIAFSTHGSLPDTSAFELESGSGVRFLSNCHVPLDGKVTFRQGMNAASLWEPDLRYALEVEIAQKTYDWLSLEMHLPKTFLAEREAANVVVTARAAAPTSLAIGYGGILDRGRGFDCFLLRDHRIGLQYKTISTELHFSTLPMDEIEADVFVVAVYFNNTDETTVTLADFRVDLL